MPALPELQAGVKSLSALERKQFLIEEAKSLSPPDKLELSRTLGTPTQVVTDKIWMTVVTAFVIVFVGAFAAMALYMYLDKKVDTLLTVFTTVTAFLAGLLAPSPVAGKG